jgi:hypothetical protein
MLDFVQEVQVRAGMVRTRKGSGSGMSGSNSVDSHSRTTAKPLTRITTECDKTAEAVEKTISQYTAHLMQGALKGAVLADLIRLLQMEEEMDGNRPPQLSIGWASQGETMAEPDE